MSRLQNQPSQPEGELPVYVRIIFFSAAIGFSIPTFRVASLLFAIPDVAGAFIFLCLLACVVFGLLFTLPERWRNRCQGKVFGAFLLLDFAVNVALLLK